MNSISLGSPYHHSDSLPFGSIRELLRAAEIGNTIPIIFGFVWMAVGVFWLLVDNASRSSDHQP